MYCPKCGADVSEGMEFCPKCGAALSSVSFDQKIEKSFDSLTDAATEQVKNVYDDVKGEFEGKANAGRLETNRSLALYILLTIITLGLYSLFFIYSMARDVNTACEDGQKTRGLVAYLLLSIITFGIYPLVWEYSLANRLAENSKAYGMSFQENGTTVLLWHLFGVWICGIGPFIAMNILIKNTNRICEAYNKKYGF